MKIILFMLLFINLILAQDLSITNSFTSHKHFKMDENFIESNGNAMWFNKTDNGFDHCTFSVNITDPFNYIFVYYEKGIPTIAFMTYLVENKNGGWDFLIKDYFTNEKIKCDVKVYYIDNNSIKINFFNCKDSKIKFDSVILAKDFSHLD